MSRAAELVITLKLASLLTICAQHITNVLNYVQDMDG